MPPPDANKKPLSAAEIQTLSEWIRAGAEYRPHWSFIPPQRPEFPAVKDAEQEAWIRNSIDRFVAARLEAEGLAPSPEADRRTLIRRLSLDLTGLPPSGRGSRGVCRGSTMPDAYERLVDRLLASPHFGERMALDWLDAARYADTNGYSIDGGRHIWLWRDWVIDAFNRNMPYNEFLVEQLAGDLLPRADRCAAHRHRLSAQQHGDARGGHDPRGESHQLQRRSREDARRSGARADARLRQCHDHKYDPITQRDYYQLFAYFNTLSDKGSTATAASMRGRFSRPSTVLATDERAGAAAADRGAAGGSLPHPDAAAVAAWEAERARGACGNAARIRAASGRADQGEHAEHRRGLRYRRRAVHADHHAAGTGGVRRLAAAAAD